MKSFQRGCTATTATYTLRQDRHSYAVVGHPGRDYLWILSRTSSMSDDTYQRILARLRAQGYETSRLVRTMQVS